MEVMEACLPWEEIVEVGAFLQVVVATEGFLEQILGHSGEEIVEVGAFL
jgi:hypothetical protein